jgi:hypothetical protein
MSLVKTALIEEFKDLALKALEYKNKIDTAKTFVKKEVYKKKLKENNIKAAEILAAMEKVANAEASSKAAGAKDETLSIEGRTETPHGESASLE